MYCPTCSGSVRAMPATEQRVSLPPRYRVVRHIASGGMASVWAAQDELLGRLVAVKLLSRAYDDDERALHDGAEADEAGQRIRRHGAGGERPEGYSAFVTLPAFRQRVQT